MTHDDARKLAEEAIADDAKATPGPWYLRDPLNEWTGIVSDKCNVCGMHDGARTGDAMDDARFIMSARTREPALARLLLSALDERDRMAEALNGVRAYLDGEDGAPGVGDLEGMADYEEVNMAINARTVRAVRAALTPEKPR